MTELTFTCEEHMHGVIAEPVPANKIIEQWYRKLPMDLPGYLHVDNFGRTVKACPPFLDAMTLGYMFVMPADFKIEVLENKTRFNAGWRLPGPYLDHHWPEHIEGHPKSGQAIVKIFTMWSVRTPPGYSVMVFPPINRTELPFEAMSAVIDTDTLHTRVTIPCFINLPDGVHFVAKGTPLAQIVPFKREPISVTIRAEATDETKARNKQEALVLSEIGAYRHQIRHKDAV